MAPSKPFKTQCQECGIHTIHPQNDYGDYENRHPPEWVRITIRSHDQELGWYGLSWFMCPACWNRVAKGLKHVHVKAKEK